MQSIGASKSIEVRHDQDEVIGRNYTLRVGWPWRGSLVPPALNGETFGIGMAAALRASPDFLPSAGNMQTFVLGSVMEYYGGAHFSSAVGEANFSYGSSVMVSTKNDYRVSVGGHSSETVNGTKSIQSDEQINIVCGASSIHLYSDGTVVIDANRLYLDMNDDIQITAGSLRIDVKEGVKINGARIDLNE